MNRGDLVTIAIQGDFGKPRPALVVQNDDIGDTAHVLVCPLTSMEGPFATLRMPVEPSAGNGLRVRSFVMISNVVAVPRARCGPLIGSLSTREMGDIDARLAFVFGLAR